MTWQKLVKGVLLEIKKFGLQRFMEKQHPRDHRVGFLNGHNVGCEIAAVAGLRRKERVISLAYPALALQLASLPRDRASFAFGEGRPKGLP
ncbi:MAG: hypothetical protein WA672_15770 [Candidatus Angelobacter sp.]